MEFSWQISNLNFLVQILAFLQTIDLKNLKRINFVLELGIEFFDKNYNEKYQALFDPFLISCQDIELLSIYLSFMYNFLL